MNRCIHFVRNPLISSYTRRSYCGVKLGINGALKLATKPPNFHMTSSTSSAGAAGVMLAAQSESIATKRTLDYDSGPMVWVDLEMTGLNTKVDKIMEIAVLITDKNLQLVDDGIQFVVKVDKEILDNMNEWCTRQHGSTGLTHACLSSLYTIDSVEKNVLDYIRQHIPEKQTAVLAGNSIHVDRMFLAEHMPTLLEHLHYRIIDVSSIKELCRRWYPNLTAPKTVSEGDAHRALADIRASIKELQWYRENIFVVPAKTNPLN